MITGLLPKKVLGCVCQSRSSRSVVILLILLPREACYMFSEYVVISRNPSVQEIYIVELTYYFILADHDECADDSHMCHVNAVCTNTEGSYECECEYGYIGDGRNCEGGLTLNPKG